jgi:hypothetical protein
MRLPAVVERRYHLPLEEMSSWTRTAGVVLGRKVFSLMAKEYGYTGGEFAGFVAKGPTAITEYLRQGEGLKREVEKVTEAISKESE